MILASGERGGASPIGDERVMNTEKRGCKEEGVSCCRKRRTSTSVSKGLLSKSVAEGGVRFCPKREGIRVPAMFSLAGVRGRHPGEGGD